MTSVTPYDDGETKRHRRAWLAKPAVRAIYEDYHRRLLASCRPGRILEVGGGSGHLKGHRSDIVSFDLEAMPWLDLAADAHALPFAEGSFDNLVAIDVLHHLAQPVPFLAEAARVLKPGGRFVVLEPAMTPLARLAYMLGHPEPIRMDADVFAAGPHAGPNAVDANQAIPTLMFVRHREQLMRSVPNIRIAQIQYLSLWAYPMSGGFQNWSMLPAAAVRSLLAIEDWCLPLLGNLAGFRLMVVCERTA